MALFSGDARRCARRFLPTSQPKRLELSRGLGVWTATVYAMYSTLKLAAGLSLVLVLVSSRCYCLVSPVLPQFHVQTFKGPLKNHPPQSQGINVSI